MKVEVTKRDGRTEFYTPSKVLRAVIPACIEANLPLEQAKLIAKSVASSVEEILILSENTKVPVDKIHNLVETQLMEFSKEAAKQYIIYREKRTEVREGKSSIMKTIEELNKEMNKDNANTDPSAATKMYQIASAVSKEYNLAHNISPKFAEMHRKGIMHIHDLDYYEKCVNCFYSPLENMLAEGFDNGVGFIRPANKITSATALTAIIIQSMQNNFFGGQGIVSFDSDLAPVVEKEYQRQYKMFMEDLNETGAKDISNDKIEKIVMKKVEKETKQAMKAMIYNLNTMKARSGNQVPFSSLNFGTDTSKWGRIVTKALLEAYIEGLGHGENPIFPNLGFRLKSGVNQELGTPNYDLYQLAIECVGRRIQPRFVFADSTYDREYWEYSARMG